MDDRDLLRRYVRERSEAAMSALVERHMPMVYAVARREVESDTIAEDVAQAVFVILAKKARHIADTRSLGSWLFTVTRYAASNARRGERRRREGETRVVDAMKREMSYDASAVWDAVYPELNNALSKLSAGEREAIILRYFRDLTMDEAGQALGISPKAAQMRIQRATDKLRAYLTRQGVAVTMTVLVSILMDHARGAHSAAASVDVARAAILNASSLPGVAAGSSAAAHTHTANAIAIAQGTLKTMKLHAATTTAAIVAATVIGVGGFAVAQRGVRLAQTPSRKAAPAAVVTPAATPYFKPLAIRLVEIDQDLTVSNGRIHLGDWSVPVRPHLKLTIRAIDGRTSIVDDTGDHIWSHTFLSAASTDFVMDVDARKNVTLTDRQGRTMWSGSAAGPEGGASPFVSPDFSSHYAENSGTQNGVLVSEWFFGNGRRFTYRVEHRAGAGHPEGDYEFFEPASVTPGGPDIIIFVGNARNGGITLNADGQVKVIGISGYPINPTFTATYDFDFMNGKGTVIDESAGGKQIASEAITIAKYEDAFTTDPAPADLRKSYAGVCIPEDMLPAHSVGRKDYRVTYQDDNGQVQQVHRVSLNVVVRKTAEPDSKQYRDVDFLKHDIYDGHGTLLSSSPTGHRIFE